MKTLSIIFLGLCFYAGLNTDLKPSLYTGEGCLQNITYPQDIAPCGSWEENI